MPRILLVEQGIRICRRGNQDFVGVYSHVDLYILSFHCVCVQVSSVEQYAERIVRTSGQASSETPSAVCDGGYSPCKGNSPYRCRDCALAQMTSRVIFYNSPGVKCLGRCTNPATRVGDSFARNTLYMYMFQ